MLYAWYLRNFDYCQKASILSYCLPGMPSYATVLYGVQALEGDSFDLHFNSTIYLPVFLNFLGKSFFSDCLLFSV